MNRATPPRPAMRRPDRRWPWLFLALALLPALLGGVDARAADAWPEGIRVAKSVQKFDDLWQFGAVYPLRAPRRLHARYLELAVGALSTPAETRPYLSLGPVWNLWPRSQALILEFGFSPTLIGGSTLAGRDLGGNLHFTSSLALGTRFGREHAYELSLRFQHTSNGGLSSTNPGLDVVGLTFSIDLPGQ